MTGRRRFVSIASLAAVMGSAILLTGGCSGVRRLHRQPHYAAKGPEAIKHVAVGAWAPSGKAALAQTLAQITADLVKLRKNYLVTAVDGNAAHWGSLCAPGTDGVVIARTLDIKPEDPQQGQVALAAQLELWRCADGMLAFVSEGERTTSSHEHSLSELTSSYLNQLGPKAAPYIAPAFALMQRLVAPLPDPELTEAEIEEKIELGLL